MYEGISGDGRAAERIGSMLKYIGFAPVGDMLVMVVALTPISRMSQMYAVSSKARWHFFEQISQWIFLLKLIEVAVNPEEHCYLDSYIDSEQHSSSAAQVFQELVEKLSLEDTGELLLQPLGYTLALLDYLLEKAIDSSANSCRRRSACRLLCFLLRRAAEPEIMCMLAPVAGGLPTPTVVPNRLFPLRERIICHIESRIDEVFRVLMEFDYTAEATTGVNYSGYRVERSFTAMRSLLVELVVLMVESDEAVSVKISPELWKTFMSWAITYAHNNIYHAFFYRLLFAVLRSVVDSSPSSCETHLFCLFDRQSQEPTQRTLFLRVKFIAFIAESFVPFPTSEDEVPPKRSPPEIINKYVARGLIMNCANAIRLQVR